MKKKTVKKIKTNKLKLGTLDHIEIHQCLANQMIEMNNKTANIETVRAVCAVAGKIISNAKSSVEVGRAHGIVPAEPYLSMKGAKKINSRNRR